MISLGVGARIFGGLLSVLLLGFSGLVSAQESVQRVTALTLDGNRRIETSAVQGRLTLRVGDPYSPAVVRNQIRLLYETGFFEDVQSDVDPNPDGVAVTFHLKEKPFITEIVYDGNEELSEDKLKEKTTIKSQAFLDPQQVKESAEKIRSAYQEEGYYNCSVTPIIQTLDEDRKRLTFYVKEGERARIKSVVFEGARSVTRKEMFAVIATREWAPWYHFFTKFTLPSIVSDSGILKREEVPNDVERIREIYMNRGYLNVQVGLPTIELTEDKKWFIVTFAIVEGEPFTVEQIGFRGNTIFEETELRDGMKITEGEIFQRQKIRDEITRLTDKYGGKGYAFTDVNPNVNPNQETKTASIIFNIKEGELTRIRQIRITGNDKTRDNVIRRELRVDESDVIDTVSIKRSFQRLNNLNYFETVEILPKQIAPDTVDLDVKVKEKSTGMFSIGGGFSTLDKLVAVADITEGNLGGNGYVGRIRGQLGQRRSIGLVSFRNPYLNDSLTSFQADIYSTLTNYLTYFEEKAGVSMTFGRWFSEYIFGSITPFAEQLNYSDATLDAPEFILLQLGRQTTTGMRALLARDTRDYYLDPRTGLRTSIGFDFGTPFLGGSNDFIKYTVDVIKYTPLLFDTRLALRGRYGVVDGQNGKPIPLTERFFVGGINSMRGFVFGRAGPVTPSGSLLGSAKELIFNVDFIFPISTEAKLNGVLFFDYGNGFDEGEKVSFNLRKAVGFEARWISPFGPLRAAYGINLAPRPQERRGVFEFTVGSLF